MSFLHLSHPHPVTPIAHPRDVFPFSEGSFPRERTPTHR